MAHEAEPKQTKIGRYGAGTLSLLSSEAGQFILLCERALQLLDTAHLRAVVLLYRADKANTQDRIEVFNRAAHELTVTARTKWIPGSGGDEKSPRWWFVWIVWLGGKEGPPVNRRIKPCRPSAAPGRPLRGCEGRAGGHGDEPG